MRSEFKPDWIDNLIDCFIIYDSPYVGLVVVVIMEIDGISKTFSLYYNHYYCIQHNHYYLNQNMVPQKWLDHLGIKSHRHPMMAIEHNDTNGELMPRVLTIVSLLTGIESINTRDMHQITHDIEPYYIHLPILTPVISNSRSPYYIVYSQLLFHHEDYGFIIRVVSIERNQYVYNLCVYLHEHKVAHNALQYLRYLPDVPTPYYTQLVIPPHNTQHKVAWITIQGNSCILALVSKILFRFCDICISDASTYHRIIWQPRCDTLPNRNTFNDSPFCKQYQDIMTAERLT
jgi:hypothetical protein